MIKNEEYESEDRILIEIGKFYKTKKITNSSTIFFIMLNNFLKNIIFKQRYGNFNCITNKQQKLLKKFFELLIS